MKYCVVLAIFLTSLYNCTPSKSKKEVEKAITVMAYYVPEKEYQPEKLPLDQLTHIIFSFTNVIDGEMEFRHEETGKSYDSLWPNDRSIQI